jgi:hypothetical protein
VGGKYSAQGEGYPVSEADSSGLRELAHRYYTGELSYESYRSERTSLLDRLTQQSAYQMSTSNTRPMLEKTRVVPVSSRRRHPVWILILIVVLIAVLIWLLRSGWMTISLAAMQLGAAETSVEATAIRKKPYQRLIE